MAVEDESKRYYEPKAPGEKAFWKLHVVQKHLHPVAPEHQFTGGRDKDHSRSQDTKDYREPNALPGTSDSYLHTIARVIAGLREERINEAPQNDVAAQSPQGQGDAQDKQGEPAGGPPGDENGENTKVGENISGSDAKQQLETIALQSAEMFAEIDEKDVFDDEVKEALSTAMEALGTISAVIMGDANQDGKVDDPKSDDQNSDNNANGNSKKIAPSDKKPTLQKEEIVISEISKGMVGRYLERAGRQGRIDSHSAGMAQGKEQESGRATADNPNDTHSNPMSKSHKEASISARNRADGIARAGRKLTGDKRMKDHHKRDIADRPDWKDHAKDQHERKIRSDKKGDS